MKERANLGSESAIGARHIFPVGELTAIQAGTQQLQYCTLKLIGFGASYVSNMLSFNLR